MRTASSRPRAAGSEAVRSPVSLAPAPIDTPTSTSHTPEVEVSIVIPCRNESIGIGAVVRDARAALQANGYVGEVIVVDNGSTDQTRDEAVRAGATVVSQPIRGYGAACLRGIEAMRGDIVVFVDGDGTYDLSVLSRFVEPLRAGYEMVLGTRRNGEIERGAMRRRHRHLLEPLQTHFARRFLPFPVSDVRCGMRSLRRDALAELDLGGATGMEFSAEMLVEAARLGLTTVEVPVVFRPRSAEQSRRNVEDGWRLVRYLLLVSPTRLFVVPGILMLVGGLALELVLVPGPLRVAGVNLDFHLMFVGGAAAILGLQLVLLGLYAKTYALVQNAGTFDSWLVRFHLHYSLERGIILGGTLFAAGLLINVYILTAWASAGGGVIFAVRPAMLALTLMVLGAEIGFAAVFLSLLRGAEFGKS
jgi:glycosyltransferase involved in cell wall biosynthesis